MIDDIKTAMIIGLLAAVWMTVLNETVDGYVEEFLIDEESYFGEAISYKTLFSVLATLILILFVMRQKPKKKMNVDENRS